MIKATILFYFIAILVLSYLYKDTDLSMISKKRIKTKQQSPNLDELDDYTRTRVFLGGKR